MIPKIRTFLRFTLHVAIGAVVLATVPWLVGAALAATGVAPPVPPPGPDALAAYLTAYGPIVGALAVAYVVVGALLRKYASSHWLAQGKRLAWVTAGLGVAGTALQAYVSGTPVSGVIATAVLGLLHIADAQVAPPPATKTAQSGRVTVAALAWLGMVGLVVLAVAACAGSQREDTIKAALVTVDSARDGFLAYDRAHEQQLVAEAVNADDARSKLAAYQAKRAKVDPLFTGAYHGIAAAELLNTDQSLTSMQSAIAQLIEALKPFLGSK